MSEPLANPPPLNPHREWPHKVTPLPLDWLITFTTLGEVKAPEPEDEVWN